MTVFKILKILSQVSGVFPFEKKNVYYVSKLYLLISSFVGLGLIILFGFGVKEHIEVLFVLPKEIPARYTKIFFAGDITIFFGQIAASLTAIVTKFAWRKEFVNNLNVISRFKQEHKLIVSSNMNLATMSNYLFSITFSVVLAIKIVITIIKSRNYNSLTLYIYGTIVDFPMIMDEMMLCAIFLMLSIYQKIIKQMAQDLAKYEETGNISSIDINWIPAEITVGNFFQNHIHRIDVNRRTSQRSGRAVPVLAQKLERLRQMNLKIFNIYTNYSAMYQCQSFIFMVTSIIEITYVLFTLFLTHTLHIRLDLISLGSLIVKVFLIPLLDLIKLFMLCYYTEKAYTEGVDIKYTIQEIIHISNEKNFNRVSKIFMEQLHSREEFQIAGLFSVNMKLPITFLQNTMNYAVVLIQYLGLKLFI